MLNGHNNTNARKEEPQKEEVNDCLLTIGTFGNNQLPIKNEETETDLSEFTLEEVGKLQKELTKLLSKKPAQLPLDRFLNCPSSLEVDRRLSVELNDKEEDIDRTIRVILGRCRDKKATGNKSISLLFKKIFVCGNGFPAIPSLCHPLPESRMEKLLRAMLKKKINPRASSARKLIKDRRPPQDEDENEKEKGGSKWVKTDSEYIVLEI
ncbi:hypothetical protein L1987_22717 [Smallanthus sonchifolius]|uniref:Uncharacterized protein n=1 Tax=Smallanthus sonchifolius TaxID=185202 RepID=A0ACB9IIA7_9ASTR|nr:hypothetical protein L1987_22717 [Smallanthus sonchifolius]